MKLYDFGSVITIGLMIFMFVNAYHQDKNKKERDIYFEKLIEEQVGYRIAWEDYRDSDKVTITKYDTKEEAEKEFYKDLNNQEVTQ